MPAPVRCMILAAVLALNACTPAAPPVSAPAATPIPTAPTLATATDVSDVRTTLAPDVVPTAALVETVKVPVPALIASAWTAAPRTKTAGCISQGGLPDPACTPGAIDPRVSIATTAGTICTSGYTATVRPPVSVTDRIKREQMAAYGLQGQRLADYELDHLISLELGGAPSDIANLWPEPWTGDANAHQKDAVETHLKREVCAWRRVTCGRSAHDCGGLVSGLSRERSAAGSLTS